MKPGGILISLLGMGDRVNQRRDRRDYEKRDSDDKN